MLSHADTKKFVEHMLASATDLEKEDSGNQTIPKNVSPLLRTCLHSSPSYTALNNLNEPNDLTSAWLSLCNEKLSDMQNPREFLIIFLAFTQTAALRINDADKRDQFIALMANDLHDKFQVWANRYGGWEEAYGHWDAELRDTLRFLEHEYHLLMSLSDKGNAERDHTHPGKPDLMIAEVVKTFLGNKVIADTFNDMILSIERNNADTETIPLMIKEMSNVTQTSADTEKERSRRQMARCAAIIALFCHAEQIITDEASKTRIKGSIARELHRLHYYSLGIDECGGWMNRFSSQSTLQQLYELTNQWLSPVFNAVSTSKQYFWNNVSFFAKSAYAYAYASGTPTAAADENKRHTSGSR